MTEQRAARKPLRVALVYLGRKGGGAIYSLEIAKALARLCEVIPIVSAQAQNLVDWQATGLRVLEVPTYTGLVSFALASLDIRRHLRLRQMIKKLAPDVLYYPMTHLWTPIINVLSGRIPKVITLHDPVPHLGEANALLNVLARITLRQATRVIVLSRAFVPTLVRQGIETSRIDVIPHGEFSFYRRMNPQRGPRHTSERPQTILFFGRISPYKGIDVLLDAYRDIQARVPGVCLKIVGSGDLRLYRDQLRQLPGVTVVNRWVADDEVSCFFTEADLVVLPYVDASQSGVIPIAYSFGVPVVATRVGGLPEQVDDGVTGRLVRPRDSNELAAACVELLQDSVLRERMGRAALEKAAAEWSWRNIAQRVFQVLEAAAGKPE
ncbi:MAG: glycosyltransferase family 4 protein [Desulfofundulus sp.]